MLLLQLMLDAVVPVPVAVAARLTASPRFLIGTEIAAVVVGTVVVVAITAMDPSASGWVDAVPVIALVLGWESPETTVASA
jgi:hypothetical protein